MEKTEQGNIRFLTKLKKTATKTLLSEVYAENDSVTVFSQIYFRGCFKTWNACRELYVDSDGDYFQGVQFKC
jgi:hypothetical protein